MPPEGSWRPNVSLGSVLVTVHVLLGAPNLDDPVRPDLISEWESKKETEIRCNEIKIDGEAIDENSLPSNEKFPSSKRTYSLSLSNLRKKSKTNKN